MSKVIDGLETVQDGMNGLLDPGLITGSEIAKGINLDLRGGHAKTRAALVEHEITCSDANALKFMREGKYQGGTVYAIGGKQYVVFGVFGRIYRFDPELCDIVDLTPATGPLSAGVARLYFCQANDHLVVQDGQNRPLLIAGGAIRQSAVGDDPLTPEVPVGTIMAFGHGRLFVVVDRRYIMAGDIQLAWEPDNVLHFTETGYLSGGGAFGLPSWMGRITGLAFQQNVVSGTGLGALVVFAEGGVCSFSVQLPRSTWNATDISRILYRGPGGTGPATIVPVGNDLFYMATDGLRTLRVTAGELEGSGAALTSIPLSNRIRTITADETPWAFKYASGVFHDHRLYMTSIARKHNVVNEQGNKIEDFHFDGILTVDTNTVTERKIVFEGVTTGAKFLEVFEVERYGAKRLVAFGKNAAGLMTFYVREDHAQDNRQSPIPCRLYTPGYAFAAGTIVQKKLEYVELWLSAMRGNVAVTVYARADNYHLWTRIGTAAFSARDESDGTENVWTQIRQKIRISTEGLNMGDEITQGRNSIVGSRLQLCVEWAGRCQVDRVMLVAETQPDEGRIADELSQDNIQLTGAALMDYEYKIGEHAS